ncbi:MAG: YihY/virulence factor BrkB family protein [Chloroflexota bacterium]|nr:YihY/virulence factor BrkB family protein [Chloroflexota bacterium]
MAQLERRGHSPETTTVATLKRTFREFSEDHGTDWAAALTYYGVLALFPALIAMVSIVGLVADPATVTQTLTDVVKQVSPTAVKSLQGPIQEVTASKGKSGIFAIVGIVLALNAASGYVGAFIRASNQQYEVDEGRGFFKLRPLQIGVTLVMIMLLVIAAVAVIVTGPLAEAVGNAIGVGSTAVTVWDIAKWPVLLLIVGLMISVLYFAAPNAKLPGFKFITAGSALAVVVWIIASMLFAFYVANFGSYGKTYGTLGGIISFLVWLWITNIAILLGNELNAERARSEQLRGGDMRAERELQLPERNAPKEKKRPKTA